MAPRPLLELVLAGGPGTAPIVLEVARSLYREVRVHDHGGSMDLDEPGLSLSPDDIRRFDDLTGAGDLFVAIREVDIRADVMRRLGRRELTRIIHPTAFVSPSAVLGGNVFVGPQCTVGVCAEIGDRVFINAGSSIDYHSTVAADCFIGTGVAIPSSVTVGARCFLGAGVVFRPEVSVGPDCLLGVVGAACWLHGSNRPLMRAVCSPAFFGCFLPGEVDERRFSTA